METYKASSVAGKLDSLLLREDDYLSGETDITVFDIEVDLLPKWRQRSCLSHSAFKSVVDESLTAKKVRTRIISFHSPWTVLPLQACKGDLEVVFKAYEVNPLFADTIMAFGTRPNPEEGGSSPGTVTRTSLKSFECWYRLQYMEKNNRSKIDPWSARHTAIYHRHNAEQNFNLILIFHPSDHSKFEQALLDHEIYPEPQDAASRIMDDPRNIHVVLCETYLGIWREHLKEHTKRLRAIDDDVEDIDLVAASDVKDLDMIRELHRHHETSTKAAIFCQGNSNVLQQLTTINECIDLRITSRLQQRLSIMASRSRDHAAGYHLLQDRVKHSIEHLQYAVNHQNQALAIKNQQAATRLNETLLQLTYNAADDGATIKVITVLGLIFLPGSFIATLFGMNFFVFDGDRNQLKLGNNIWVFLAFWISLTMLTLSIYGWFAWRRRALRKKRKMEWSTHIPLEDRLGV